MNLGNTEEIRLLINLSQEEMTDVELSTYIRLANRELISKFSTSYFDYFRVSVINNLPQKSFPLYYIPKSKSVDKVILNSTILDEADYSLENNILTININLTYNDILQVYYVPEVYDILVNYITCKLILFNKLIVAPDSDIYKSYMRDIQNNIDDIITNLTKKPLVVGWTERS